MEDKGEAISITRCEYGTSEAGARGDGSHGDGVATESATILEGTARG